jgi:hypothetical protein
MLSVDAIAEKLDRKLSKWKPEISQEVRALVSEVIGAAGNDALDVMRSRRPSKKCWISWMTPRPVKCGWLISTWPRRRARS